LSDSSLLSLNFNFLALKSGYRNHWAWFRRLILLQKVSPSFGRLRVIFLDQINLLANLKPINLRHLNIGQHDLVCAIAASRRQLHRKESDSLPALKA